MPVTSVEYEYRIHDGVTALATFYAGSGGALLVASSVPGGTNPWLTAPPAGDGTTIDPLTGKTRAGAWSVSIGDPITSGTDRLVTSVLEDSTRGWRSRLTSRRAFARERENGGAWVTTWVGFVSRVRYPSAAEVQITHTDSPARDKDAAAATQRPTESVSAYVARWPLRACVAGGPIRGGWLFRQDPGGWDCLVESQSGGYTVFRVTSAYAAPSFQRRTVNMGAALQTLNDAARPYFVGSALLGGSFPRLTVETFTPGGASTFSDPVVLASPIYVPTTPSGPGPVLGSTPQYFDPTLFCSQERITVAGTVGTVGQVRRLRVLALDPSEAFPVYATAHPVTLVETLLTEQGLTVDSTSRDAVRDLLGTAARVSVRIAAVRNFWRFAEDLLAPYGVALRATAGGAVGFVAIRRTTSSLPTTTITLDDLAETDGEGIYEVAEQSVVARVAFASVLYGPASPSDDTGPPDGILAQPIRVEREAWDIGTEEAPRTLTLEADAMFHVDGQLESDAPRLGTAIAQDAFLRSRGGTVEIGELVVRRGTTPAALRVGDECLVNLPHLPHRNKRLGDDGSVPPRVATVVRAQVEPIGVRLQLADAGSAAIDGGTAPTASVVQDSTFPRQCVALTITNAATLNAAGRGVRVQVAVTSGAAPAAAAYTDLVAYAPGAVPTAAERLGPFTPGQTVYLRLRAEQPGLRPGAWQTAISAALASTPAPTGISVAQDSRGWCDITWTPGDATAVTHVAVRRTADAAPGRTVAVVPSGSGQVRIYWEPDADVFGTASVGYTVDLWHVDGLTAAISALASTSLTRVSFIGYTATAPIAAFVQSALPPAAGQPCGVELSIASQAVGEPLTVWRGATNVRANAVRVAVLDADATTFRDYLPFDAVARHYWVEYLRPAALGATYVGSTTPGALRDAAGSAIDPRPTIVPVAGVLYAQSSSAFAALGGGGASVGGAGTTGRLAKWASGASLADAVVEDDGTHFFPTVGSTRDNGTAARPWRDVQASRDMLAGGRFVGRQGGATYDPNTGAHSFMRRAVGEQTVAVFGNDSTGTTKTGFFVNVDSDNRRVRLYGSGDFGAEVGIYTGNTEALRITTGADVFAPSRVSVGSLNTGWRLHVAEPTATSADIFLAGMVGVTNGLVYRRAGGAFEFDVTTGRVRLRQFGDPVSNARLSVIGSGATGEGTFGNGIEFGHPNTAGYRSVLGAWNTNGNGFIALHGEHGTGDNTFRTRGVAGVVFLADLNGGFSVRSLTSNADNQSGSQRLNLTANGQLTVLGPSASVEAIDRSASGSMLVYRTAGINRLWDSTYGDTIQYDGNGTVRMLRGDVWLGADTTAPRLVLANAGVSRRVDFRGGSADGGWRFTNEDAATVYGWVLGYSDGSVRIFPSDGSNALEIRNASVRPAGNAVQDWGGPSNRFRDGFLSRDLTIGGLATVDRVAAQSTTVDSTFPGGLTGRGARRVPEVEFGTAAPSAARPIGTLYIQTV